MEIMRIGGGIEYWTNSTSLIFPGDTDYRVRTAKTNNRGIVQSPRVPAETTGYVRAKLSLEGSTTANEKALAFLMHLGEMEAEGDFVSYPDFGCKDEYAGGHYGIIDIFA